MENTFDAFPLDCFDRDVLTIILVVALENIPILARPNLAFEYVVINYFGHFELPVNIIEIKSTYYYHCFLLLFSFYYH